MGSIIDIIVSAIPWLQGVISQADVLVSAIPWSGVVTSFLVLLLVGSWIFFKEEFRW